MNEEGKTAAARQPLLIDLALQGGGAHGAFTWGVLDRLLEEPWLDIDGISGTPAAQFLAMHGDALGNCSSFDLDALLQEV